MQGLGSVSLGLKTLNPKPLFNSRSQCLGCGTCGSGLEPTEIRISLGFIGPRV